MPDAPVHKLLTIITPFRGMEAAVQKALAGVFSMKKLQFKNQHES
jgi:hypothetical protein